MQIVETQLSRHFREFLSSCRSLNFIFQPDDETSANVAHHKENTSGQTADRRKQPAIALGRLEDS